jgi:hypothetical protein
MKPLFDTVLQHVPTPEVDAERPAAAADLRRSTTPATSAASASAASRAAASRRVQNVLRDERPRGRRAGKASVNQVLGSAASSACWW